MRPINVNKSNEKYIKNNAYSCNVIKLIKSLNSKLMI